MAGISNREHPAVGRRNLRNEDALRTFRSRRIALGRNSGARLDRVAAHVTGLSHALQRRRRSDPIRLLAAELDPDGLDDHLHLPSSYMKKVTERYRPVDDKTMTLTITHEDPLFLLKPYTWTIQLQKAAARPEGVYNCDTEFNYAEIDAAMRDPYANVNRSTSTSRTGDTRNRN